MPKALGTARWFLCGLAVIITLMVGRPVVAQHAPVPGPHEAQFQPNDERPQANHAADPRGESWRDRFNPLAPLAPLGRAFGGRGHDGETPPLQSVERGPAIVPQGAAAPVLTELRVRGQYADRWREGEAEAYLIRGECELRSGSERLTAQQVVLWRTPMQPGATRSVVVAYLEGDVRCEGPDRAELEPASFLERTFDSCVVETEYRPTERSHPPEDPLYQRARQRRAKQGPEVHPVQFTNSAQGPMLAPPQSQPMVNPLPAPGPVQGTMPGAFMGMTSSPRHVAIYPRALGQDFSLQTFESQDTLPREFVTTVAGGVRVVIDGVALNLDGQPVVTTVDLSADRAVIWTDADRVTPSFELGGDAPLEVYLEGDIVVRQGENVIHASRAYYSVSEERGLFWDCDLRGFVPQLNSPVRLRAQQVRQLAHEKFQATNAWISTSDMGIPGYRIEASDLFLERRPMPGVSRVDPATGEVENGMLWFSSRNNRLYVENLPVAYLPYLSSPAENPNLPLKRINLGYSRIFGAEVKTVWDPAALFGFQMPDGLKWDVRADYLSSRGPAGGTDLQYDGPLNILGLPAVSHGQGGLYYIHDTGTDNLGPGRRALVPSTQNRGRAVFRNRIDFPFNTWLTTELGYLSDRNVREQYWRDDWWQGKDYENLVQLNHQYDNFTGSLMFRGRLFDFETTTSWLPKLDATLLAQPIPGTPLLWSTHSSVGYGHLQPAAAPTNPQDIFTPLPWVADRQGLVAMTRHGIDLPFSLGPVNVVPYGIGEAAYWQEDLSGDSLGRLWGSAGVRASIMFSKFMPQVYSQVFGLNGLAHKMVFDVDYSYSRSSTALGNVAQYNEFDEDAQERFRTRYPTLDFGGVIPAIYDPRFYAVRSGAGQSVTAPWHELVDDMHVARFGWRHRWQTRVGTPQAPRIYDWMTLDLEASLYPNASRDNFGENFGLIGAQYAWNVGPRTRFLANTVFDLFDGGQRVWNVGVLSNRFQRGNVYLGVRGLELNNVDTALLVASASYQPSDKWIWTVGTAYDIVANMDRGQTGRITRVGEYLLFHFGGSYDRTTNAWSANIAVEPKFGNFRIGSNQLNTMMGP